MNTWNNIQSKDKMFVTIILFSNNNCSTDKNPLKKSYNQPKNGALYPEYQSVHVTCFIITST